MRALSVNPRPAAVSRPIRLTPLLALSVLLGAGASRALAQQCPDGTPPPCAARAARPVPAAPTSVAVLAFRNLSRDSGEAYLADGLTEEVTSRLADVGRIEVKSRSAVRSLRSDAASDLAALGRRLRVRFFVEGSVQCTRARCRVSVGLVRADNGFRVWGRAYDRETADILSLQADIARDVARNIAGRLLPEERAALAIRPTQSPEAYDHLLRGNRYLAQRNAQSVRTALEEYERALALDPSLHQALARTAAAYNLFLYWGWPYPGLPPDSLLARGLAAARSALESDSTDSDAWMAQGMLLSRRFPRTFEGALQALDRAIALAPRNNAEAYHQLGALLRDLGDDSGAVRASHSALQIDPDRPVTHLQLATIALIGRRFPEALAWLDSALAVDPAWHWALALRAEIKVRLGDTVSARADAEQALRLGNRIGEPLPAQVALALVAAAEGDIAGATARVRALAALAPASVPLSVQQAGPLAIAWLAIGDRTRALETLERVQPRGAPLWSYLRYPEFDPLRRESRFEQLVEASRPRGP